MKPHFTKRTMRTNQARKVDAVQDQNLVPSQDRDPVQSLDRVQDHERIQDLDRVRDHTRKNEFPKADIKQFDANIQMILLTYSFINKWIDSTNSSQILNFNTFNNYYIDFKNKSNLKKKKKH